MKMLPKKFDLKIEKEDKAIILQAEQFHSDKKYIIKPYYDDIDNDEIINAVKKMFNLNDEIKIVRGNPKPIENAEFFGNPCFFMYIISNQI